MKTRLWIAATTLLALITLPARLAVLSHQDHGEEAGESKEAGDQPMAASQYDLLKRLPPGADAIPMDRYLQAMEQMADMPRFSTATGQSTSTLRQEKALGTRAATLNGWKFLGPGNIGGRTRALLVHPTNASIMYAAGVGGGVWKTTNGGASWTPLDDLLPNLAVTSLAMDRANPNVIYAGTGEGVFNADALRGGGIFKTSDAGATWTNLNQTLNAPDFYYVNKVIVSPVSSQRVYAATNTGVWMSADSGSTWKQSLAYTTDAGCLDMAVRTDQTTDYLFAACGFSGPSKIYRNTDAAGIGQWSVVFTDTNLGRTSLAIAPSSQGTVYAMGICGNKANCGQYYLGLLGVYKSTSSGASGSWTAQVTNKDPRFLNTLLLTNAEVAAACFNPASFPNQGWYDNVIAVDPTNPNVVFTGGIDVFRSDDGGHNWSPISYWWGGNAPQTMHADIHALVFHPQYNGTTNQIMYVGNDGGLYTSQNVRATTGTAACTVGGSVTWRNLNNGYGVTQFYQGLPYPDGTAYFGGAQDNGTVRGTDAAGPNAWTTIRGGDGGYVAIDPTNTAILYSDYINLSLAKSVDGGASFQKATNGIDDGTPSSNYLFIVPVLMDPTNHLRLYLGGVKLWRTSDGAQSWSIASPLLRGAASDRVSAIAVARSNANSVLVGTSGGYIHRLDGATTSNASTNWTTFVQPRAGFVSSLEFDPDSDQTAFATYSSFNSTASQSHVYRTADGGKTWTGIDGSGAGKLPDMPVHTLVIDPSNKSRMYVGSDLGVFVTLDGGATWAVENTGFPNVSTDWLALNTAGGSAQLFAFTHGRGAWKVPFGNFCSYSLSATGQQFAAAGGNGSVDVIAAPGCPYTAVTMTPWINITSGASGAGMSTVKYTVAANTTALTRTGTIVIAGKTYTVTQSGTACTYTLTPTSKSFDASGGTGTIGIATASSCTYTAQPSASWITINGTASGSGNGSVSYTVAPNPATTLRTGTITIGGVAFGISEAGLATGGGGILNDEVPGATSINVLPFGGTEDTRGATGNTSDPVHSCTGQRDSNTVWFKFTAGFSGAVQVTTGGSTYDTVLSAYAGSATANNEVACNDDASDFTKQSFVSFDVVNGTTYFLEIAEYGASNIGGTLKLALSANDSRDAATIIGGLPFSATQDVRGTTGSASDPVHACTGQTDSHSVWFRYVAPAAVTVMVDTLGSDYSTVLSVYRTGTTTGIVCDHDGQGLGFSGVAFPASAGQSYDIEVSAFGNTGPGGTLVLNVAGNDDPANASLLPTPLPFNTTQYDGLATTGASDPKPSCVANRPPATLWFRYVADASGQVQVNTAGSNYNTVVAVFAGSTSPGTELACNDDVDGTAQSRTSFTAVNGQSYLILVGAIGSIPANILALEVKPDATCSYSLNPSSATVSAATGAGSFALTASPGCPWTASSDSSWLVVTSAASGSGNATINYSYSANTGAQRTGGITIGGQKFTLTQQGSQSALADLVVTSFTAPSAAAAGGSINISINVKNQGTARAGAFRVEFFLSRPGGDIDTTYGCYYDFLEAGASAPCSGAIGIPSNVPPGTFTPKAVADDMAAIAESDKTNNTRLADSGPIAITGSGCTYQLDSPGQQFTAIGGTGSVNLITGASCPYAVSFNVPWITVTSPVNGVGPGPIAYSVAVNNTSSPRVGVIVAGLWSYTVTQAAGPPQAPDLIVTAFTAPTNGVPGGQINVSATVRNQGTAAAGPFRLELFLENTDTTYGCDYNGLAAGAQSDCSGPINLPNNAATGLHTLRAVADSNNQVLELDETNNSRNSDNGQILISSSLCAYSLTPASGSFGAIGGSGGFTVSTAPSCAWSAASNAAWVTLTQPAAGVGSGAVQFNVAANFSTSSRTAAISVGNQSFTVRQSAGPPVGPDLIVTAFSAPLTGVPGGQIDISATVKNQGTAAAGAFRLEFFVENVDTTFGCDFGSLAAGASSTCAGGIEIPASVAPGLHVLRVVADNNNQVQELDETNNARVADTGQILLAAGCNYAVSPASGIYPASGANGSFTLTTAAGCAWSAVSNAPWVTVTSPVSGSGSGTAVIAFTVGANASLSARSAAIQVGGQTFTVNQQAATAPGADLVVTSFSGPNRGAIGGQVDISVTVKNQGTGPAGTFRVAFLVDNVDTGYYCTFDSLGAGQSSTCAGAIGVPSNIIGGLHSLFAVADPDNAVVETNENNNTRVADTGLIFIG